MENNSVSLQISKDIVNPIVEAKIKEAVTEALGGKQAIIEKVVGEVLKQKVNYEGRVSSYSSDNKYSWLDAVFNEQVMKAVNEELKSVISQQSNAIKDELIRQLKTNKGANQVASALLAGFEDTLKGAWRSTIKISINEKKED